METNFLNQLIQWMGVRATSILAVLLWISANPLYAEEKEARVRTTAGDLVIRMGAEGDDCGIFVNRKRAIKLDCDGSYLPRVLKDFKGNFGIFDEVVILQEVPAGNACNGGPLHLITLSKDRRFSTLGPVDFCGGKDPVIKREADKITIIFPGGPPNRGTGVVPTERWMYHDGRIARVK